MSVTRRSPLATCAASLVLLATGGLATACAEGDDVRPASHTTPPSTVVFVSTMGDDNASGAAADEAVATIQTGMLRAVACAPAPCSVHIAEGAYEGPIELVAGVHLVGGFAEGFAARDPALHAVALTSNESPTITATDITAKTTIDGLVVRGATLDASADGRSTYAVWVNGATEALVIANSRIEAGHAADGARGADGQLATCSAVGGQGGTAFDCGGSAGSAGSAGSDASSGGEGGPGGSSNCPSACPLVGADGISDGGVGAPGGHGANGTGGVIADDRDGAFTLGLWQGAVGGAGQAGKHGTGGGGGGSGGTKKFAACFGCGTLLGGAGGDGGPGGCGGLGGEPGGSGGGSFGLALVNATITLQDVAIVGGRGGRGGTGGDGAVGAPGGPAGEDPEGAGGQQCGAIHYASGGGGLGGPGGKGGWGGGGSGGVGGVSIGVALVGASGLVEVGENAITPGEAGAGGEGGLGGSNAQQGFDGDAAEKRAYPGDAG